MTDLINKMFESEIRQLIYVSLAITCYIDCVADLIKDNKKFKMCSEKIKNLKLQERGTKYVFHRG